MRNTLNKWVMLGAVAFLGLTAADANAWHAAAVAVAACQKGSTTGAPETRWDGMYNVSTSQNMYLDCSLPLGANTETYTLQAQVYYTDNSASEEVVCSFQLRDWDGSLLETGGTRRSGVAAVSAQQYFTWNSFVNHDGLPYASCQMPKAVGSAASAVHGMGVSY